ncbi:Uncharacterized protein C24H6.11c [Durusdinium trenchii]|uniref:Uncharacterized protein C24H6.11c n=1 Tax=Durusdinium trenchii TaxID=1381693 RepID=A0ABP0L709_9DINO
MSPFVQLNSAKLQRRAVNGDVAGQQALLAGEARAQRSPVRTMAFGLINGVVMIPTMVGFASIIYKDPFFTDDEHNFLPQAIKLTFLSASIHQLCFLLFSTLPFAVGQVQDAGLIFLSSMAGAIVASMTEDHREPDPGAVMSTTVVSLSLCTFVLGLLLILTGKLKLASLVQYLPLPVIGGYLAFIGLFCGLSGVRLTTGTHIDGVLGLKHVLNAHSLKLLLPGVLATAFLFLVSRKAKGNQFILPMCMISMPILFYIVVFASGHSLQDARDAGWVAKATATPVFYEVFQLFDFAKVEWTAAFPQVVPTFFAMFAVVAFGSSLDVAAIQFEIGKPMDYDHELITVGISNAISGATGGYTGSYIFSQTIFTLRNGIDSRLCGLVVVAVELSLFLLPVDLLSVLPRFFFGAVLLFVSVDLLLEWLVHSYWALDLREYVLVVATFVFINIWGLEAGMTLGVVCSALHFIYSYSKTNSVEVVDNPSSKAVRSYHDRRILRKYSKRVVALKCNGYQFFGTVISTIVKVQSQVVIKDQEALASRHARANLQALDLADAHARAQMLQSSLEDSVHTRLESSSRGTSPGSDAGFKRTGGGGGSPGNVESGRRLRTASDAEVETNSSRSQFLSSRTEAGAAGGASAWSLRSDNDNSRPPLRRLFQEDSPVAGKLRDQQQQQQQQQLSDVETRFVVLDMSNALGIDATAARACFLTILQSLVLHDIQLVFAGLDDLMVSVLRKNGVLPPELQDGRTRSSTPPSDASSGSYQRLAGDVDVGQGSAGICGGDHDGLEEGDEEPDYSMHARHFETMDQAMQFCEERILGAVIVEGRSMRHMFFTTRELETVRDKYFVPATVQPGEVLFKRGDRADRLFVVESGRIDRRDMQRTYSGGSIVGLDDFFLGDTFSYTAHVTSTVTVLCLDREAFDHMKSDSPDAAIALQTALIKAMIK